MIDPEAYFGHAVRELAHDIAQEIVDEIRQHAPVESGALKASYHVVDGPRGCSIESDVDYWAAVEFGHDVNNKNKEDGPYGYVEAQPHVRPAIEVVRARRKQ